MFQRTESRFRNSLFGKKMFIYVIMLIAFFCLSAAAGAEDSPKIEIYVEIQGGETLTLEIEYDASVDKLQHLIYQETGIHEAQQRLFFGGKRIVEGHHLNEYGIQYHSRIYMAVASVGATYSEQNEDETPFFQLFDDCMLPSTGFSSLHPAALSEQPDDLRYTPVRMRLMIPFLDVDSELVRVPVDRNSWAVEWLDDRTGILEGSAFPGEGLSVIAAHNTLNDTEYGPFALLSTLELNDLIAVSGSGNDLRTFRVFANELMAPDDMEKIAAVAEREENALVLITCENESADGGYLNRRVVFAKPVN